MASPEVLAAVDDLAVEGARGFHASHVARKSGKGTEAVKRDLAELANAGVLEERFELVCPNCDRTLATYSTMQEVPIGEEVECHTCSEHVFEVTPRDILITYTPSAATFARVNRERSRSGRGKKKAKPPSSAARLLRGLRTARH